MFFNSLEFAIFLPIVFCLYWFILGNHQRGQNLLIVAASYLFYGWWDWRFLSLIIASSLVDYFLALQLGKTAEERKRKWLLAASLSFNLGILAYFKYSNFFIEQFISAFSSIGIDLQLSTLQFILPVGISFYTFQTLSYTIDVYRSKLEPTTDWVVFFAYVSFFPQLVAGPIERATQLIPQFQAKRQFDFDQAKDGMRQILWGLFKKIVIADGCALYVNEIFATHETMAASSLVLGAVLFAFQIYCDFSGYSDIAIGTARLFGIGLMQNFAFPYFSRNIAEFWRRWHISLSTWFRDYLYIPLGGSRVDSQWKLIRNIFAIFLVSGFWHGADWKFIAWGALHAFFFLPSILLGYNRRYLGVVAENRWLPNWKEGVNILLTFSLACLAWIFFRAENIGHALDYIGQIFSNLKLDIKYLLDAKFILVGIAVLIIVEWLQRDKQHAFQFNNQRIGKLMRASIYVATAFAILLFAPKEQSIFIYFQF